MLVALLSGGCDSVGNRITGFRCGRKLEESLRKSAMPEADLHVDRCDIGIAKSDGGDICFVSNLYQGARHTSPMTLDCATYVSH